MGETKDAMDEIFDGCDAYFDQHAKGVNPQSFAFQVVGAQWEVLRRNKNVAKHAHPDLAFIYSHISAALQYAGFIVMQSRVKAKPNVPEIIKHYVHLAEHVRQLETLPKKQPIPSCWPEKAGASVALKVSWSVAAAAWMFTKSINDASAIGGTLRAKRLLSDDRLLNANVEPPSKAISLFVEGVINEIKTKTLPPDHYWNAVGLIRRDIEIYQHQIQDEFKRANGLSADDHPAFGEVAFFENL